MGKAFAVGSRLSSYCRKNAHRFYRLRHYSLMKKWMNKTVFTIDKKFNYIDAYLKSKNPRVKEAAVEALGKSGNKKYTARFGKMLLQSNNLALRLILIQSIVNLKNKKGVIYLTERIKKSKQRLPVDEERRLYKAFGKIGGPNEERFLLNRFNLVDKQRKGNRKHIYILKRALILALGECGGRPYLNYITTSLKNNEKLTSYKKIIAFSLQNMKRANPSKVLVSLTAQASSDIYTQVIDSFSMLSMEGDFDFLKKALIKYKRMGRSLYPLARALSRFNYKKTPRKTKYNLFPKKKQ